MQADDDYPPPPEMLSPFRKLLTDPSIPLSAIAKEAVSSIIANLLNGREPDYSMLWRTLERAIDTR
jgi:hypothetical protein